MGRRWNNNDRGIKKHLQKTCTGVKFSITNFSWTGLLSNPAIHGERLGNTLSHSMTLDRYSVIEHYIHGLWLKTFVKRFREKNTQPFFFINSATKN